MSVSQSNSTHTTENPIVLEERTRCTSVAPLTAVSMGKVTRRSTSSAAIPLASVMITTVGALRSGKTSTSMCLAVQQPPMIKIRVASKTSARLRKEKAMILLSMFLASL